MSQESPEALWSNNTLAVVEKAKDLRQRGYFSQARACLGTLPIDTLRLPVVAIENAHICLTQGYYNHAAESLESFLPPEYDPAEEDAVLALRLQLASAKIETEGKFKKAKELSSIAWERLEDDGNDPTEEKMWIAIYYAYIIFLQFKYREEQDPNLKTSLTKRLATLQSQFQRSNRIDQAFEVLIYRIFALELPDAKSIIEQFCSQESLDQCIRGRCHYELGKIHYGLNDAHAGAAQFLLATQYYTACSNPLGLADVALENTISQEIQDNDSLRALNDALNIYKHLDYPEGESRALFHIAQYFQARGSYSAFYDIQKANLAVSERTGRKLTWCHQQLSTLSYASVQSGQLGAHLETCTSILTTLHSLEAHFLEEICAFQLSFIYLDLGDAKTSATYAQKALDLSIERKDWERASDYAEALAIAKQALAKQSASESAFEQLSNFLSEWAERDAREERPTSEFNKYSLLVTLEQKRAILIGNKQAYSNAFQWLEKAKSLISRLPLQSQKLHLAEVMFKEGQAHQFLDEIDSAYECFCEAATLFQQEGKTRQAIDMWISIAQNRLLGVGASPSVDANVALLNDALVHYQKAQHELELSNYKKKLAQCHLQQAMLWDIAYIYGQIEALPEALNHLEQAEIVRNEMREEFSTISAAEGLTLKQGLVAQGYEIYSLGLELGVKMNDVKQAWWWVQRGKARSLSDLLGLGVVLPATLLAQAEEDAEAKRLLQEEDSLVQELEKCSADRRFHLRLQLSRFREKMIKNPALESILELRSGAAVSLKSLVPLFGERTDVVCVDWATFNDAIMMFTVRPGGDPLMHKLDIKPDSVAKWKKNFLTAETLRDSKAIGWLGRLDPLVAPLAHVVKDGDLLVFSPTGELSALPLHALCIDGKPVIERHPVIYSSSLSVLRHCVIRRSETASKDSRAMVFGDPSSNRQQAALSATRLANRLNTTPLVGCDATVSAFHQTTEMDIIHYHGHATYNNEDPLQSALILSDGNVTAHDIFSIPLRAALVTLIACESAAQEIRTGDEPTGLLPALLYAGANAVVGTLWPLWDTVGGKFSDTFYDTLVSETRNDEKREAVVIDLARALQKSVLQIRKDRPAPYFWALFVLHGNWKYNKIT